MPTSAATSAIFGCQRREIAHLGPALLGLRNLCLGFLLVEHGISLLRRARVRAPAAL